MRKDINVNWFNQFSSKYECKQTTNNQNTYQRYSRMRPKRTLHTATPLPTFCYCYHTWLSKDYSVFTIRGRGPDWKRIQNSCAGRLTKFRTGGGVRQRTPAWWCQMIEKLGVPIFFLPPLHINSKQSNLKAILNIIMSKCMYARWTMSEYTGGDKCCQDYWDIKIEKQYENILQNRLTDRHEQQVSGYTLIFFNSTYCKTETFCKTIITSPLYTASPQSP